MFNPLIVALLVLAIMALSIPDRNTPVIRIAVSIVEPTQGEPHV